MGQTKRKMHALCSKENMRVIKGVVRFVVVGYIVNHDRQQRETDDNQDYGLDQA
jgi:hypothetical protein